jgi:hypothetical protein
MQLLEANGIRPPGWKGDGLGVAGDVDVTSKKFESYPSNTSDYTNEYRTYGLKKVYNGHPEARSTTVNIELLNYLGTIAVFLPKQK